MPLLLDTGHSCWMYGCRLRPHRRRWWYGFTVALGCLVIGATSWRRCGQTNSSRRLWPQGRYQLTGSSRTPLTGPSPRKVRSATDAAKDKFGKRRNSAGRATDISSRASCWPRH